MEWLSSNWIWLAFGIAALALFAFSGGGCGMSHSRHKRQADEDRPSDWPPQATRLSSPAASLKADKGAPLVPEHAGHTTDPSETKRERHHHGCC
jgi:hypothetical protein